MVTLTDFVVELLGSFLRLFVIFFTEVAFRDPLSFVAFVTGALLVLVSVGVLGYLTLGALVDLVTSDDGDGTIGRAPPQQG